MTLYLLPLLYGLLGAFTFGLRSLSIETQRLTYSRASNTKYRLRIYMGALDGLVVVLVRTGRVRANKYDISQSANVIGVGFLSGLSRGNSFCRSG